MTPRPPSSRSRQSLLALLILPVLAAYVLLARHPVDRAFKALNYPFQLDNVEGYLLDEAVQLSHGRLFYHPIDKPPYLVGNYPPFYQLCFAALIKASAPSLAWGRMITIIAVLLICSYMVFLVADGGRQALPALLCPLLFLGTYELHNWAAYARVDLLAIALSLAGLAQFGSGESRRGRMAAAALFTLAALTRQTALAAPAACVLFLAGRGLGRALRFGGLFLGLLGGISLVLNSMTDGQYFIHTILYNRNIMDWSTVGKIWRNELDRFYHFHLIAMALALAYVSLRLMHPIRFAKPPSSPPPLAAPAGEVESWEGEGGSVLAVEKDLSGGMAASGQAWETKGADTQEVRPAVNSESARLAAETEANSIHSLLTLYFFFVAPTFLAIAKAGSAENYILEPLAAGFIFLCASLGRAFRESAGQKGAWGARLLGASMAVALLFQCHWLYWGRDARLGDQSPSEAMFARGVPEGADAKAGMRLYALIRRTPGEVLCEDPIFAVLDGRRPPINPFILSQLAREDKWDETPFLLDIRDQIFDLVVTTVDFAKEGNPERYTPNMVESFKDNYELMEKVDLGPFAQAYYVYRPKGGRHREPQVRLLAGL